jgi:RNA-directed DNA polymerase
MTPDLSLSPCVISSPFSNAGTPTQVEPVGSPVLANTPAPVAKKVRFKQRVRELTWRTRGVSREEMVRELASYLRAWRSDFGFCQTPWVLVHLDSWIRRRLRSVLWTQWKHVRRPRAELQRRGVGREWAKKTTCSNLGPWRLSQDPSICQALPKAFFDALGLPRLAAGS